MTTIVIIIIGLVLVRAIKRSIDWNEGSMPPTTTESSAPQAPTTEPSSSPSSDATFYSREDSSKKQLKDKKPSHRENRPIYKADYTERVNHIDREFGIIGNPLKHSISITHFNNKFREENISARYQNFEIESADKLMEIIENNPRLCGLNVTIPYKEDVIPMMSRLDDTAAKVGAVNVIKILRDGNNQIELIGYNTDAIGFGNSIAPLIGERRKALILGTGGAAKAVKYALDKLGVESRFVSRNSSFDILGYYELSPSIMEEYQIIVNTTPLGMWPNVDNAPDIPYAYITPSHLLYDVIYRPEETLFMRKGKNYGATVKNGYEMWQLQAEATWQIWNE